MLCSAEARFLLQVSFCKAPFARLLCCILQIILGLLRKGPCKRIQTCFGFCLNLLLYNVPCSKILCQGFFNVPFARFLLQGSFFKVPFARFLLQGSFCKVPFARLTCNEFFVRSVFKQMLLIAEFALQCSRFALISRQNLAMTKTGFAK